MTEFQTAKKLVAHLSAKYPDRQTLIVGGAVRDFLMGAEVNDVDIATNIPMYALEHELKTHDIGKSKDFGIVVVVYEGRTFEIAQFRADSSTGDGRRPDSVDFIGDFEADSARRDLTINALGMSAETILDFHGGINDCPSLDDSGVYHVPKWCPVKQGGVLIKAK